MKKLNFAILGCGRVSEYHAKIIKKNKFTNLFAVCDKKILKAKRLGKKFNVKSFQDYKDLIKEKKKIDVIAILTESGNHYKDVIKLSPHFKNLIIEKPAALKVEHVIKMKNISKKFKTNLFFVQQNRFNKPIQKVFEILNKKKLGKIALCSVKLRWHRDQKYYDSDKWRGTRKLDGGVLSNQAIHHLDIMLWLMGKVRKISAFYKTRFAKIESEDTIVINFEFNNGAIGVFEATTCFRPTDKEASICIMGEKGHLEVGGKSLNKFISYDIKGIKENLNSSNEKIKDLYGNGHKILYQEILENILNNKKLLISFDSIYYLIKILEKIYFSASKNKVLFLK
jgi:UDP-N-acetyl-2-amino-2-deoxyglucuronate dehydrogenase